jgi:hypothetical protein
VHYVAAGSILRPRTLNKMDSPLSPRRLARTMRALTMFNGFEGRYLQWKVLCSGNIGSELYLVVECSHEITSLHICRGGSLNARGATRHLELVIVSAYLHGSTSDITADWVPSHSHLRT